MRNPTEDEIQAVVEELTPILAGLGLTLAHDEWSTKTWGLDGASLCGDVVAYRKPSCLNRMRVSIFHEVGHRVAKLDFGDVDDYSKFHVEADAWFHGLQIATAHGYIFDGDTLRWASRQLSTYIGAEGLGPKLISEFLTSIRGYWGGTSRRSDLEPGSAAEEANGWWNRERRDRCRIHTEGPLEKQTWEKTCSCWKLCADCGHWRFDHHDDGCVSRDSDGKRVDCGCENYVPKPEDQ